MNLRDQTVRELLNLHGDILKELRRRKIVRTSNNPVGDYTEWLVSKGLGLDLATNSAAGYDGIDSEGLRIQIKGRRTTSENPSRQLGVIRNLEKKDFDQLAAVVFDEQYEVLDAVLIPHEIIEEYATYRPHPNGHVLHLKGAILEDARVRDIKKFLSG